MKRIIPFIVVLSMAMFACSISSALTPTVGFPTLVVQTAAPPTAASPLTDPSGAATDTPTGPAANVTCNEISFYLDPLVAFSFSCNTVPEATQGINPQPQFTQVILTTYQTGSTLTPEIDVFPVQGFLQVNPPDGIASFQSALHALVAGGIPGKTLPVLNSFESAQLFHAQYIVLNVPSGSGIRYLTESVQNFVPVSNDGMYYTYQGLTSDGKYAITAVLPVSNAILPNHGDAYPGGESNQQFSDTFTPYIADVTAKLDGQPASTFAPSLNLLDDLITSIHIQP